MRQLNCIPLLLLLSIKPAYADEIDTFKNSWVAQVLKLQREIDIDAPLNKATFLGTHNSENSFSYQIPLVRYVDPNQILSIYNQLEMGIRNVEFDVHWYTNKNLKKDILLSHALDNHVGCSIFDRPVVEGLEELRSWLEKNPGEVVILYFDRGRALEGHEPRLASYLENYLGKYIYKPIHISNVSQCTVLPGTITKRDILKAGKQLVIITKGCDEVNYEEQNEFPLNWNDYVFAGIGTVPNHEFNFLDSTIGSDFTPYPDCSRSTVFKDDPQHTVPWRIFEDRTIIGNLDKPGRKILIPEMVTMVNCGINWQTLDMLKVDDERLRAAIWSWAPNYPQLTQGNCAMYKANEGIENTACEKTLSAFACKNEKDEFQIVKVLGQWSEGESYCQKLLSSNWHFATPINGNQMYLLKELTKENGLAEVWLNYVNQSGTWKIAQ